MIIALSILIIPICMILNRLGGSKNKNFRRWGIGVALAFYSILFGCIWGVFCIGTSQLFRLPITFKGDSIPEFWFNWIWVYIVGFIYGLVPFPLFLLNHWIAGLIAAGVFGIVFGTIVVLSNVKETADIFKWDRVELAYGALIGIIAIIASRLFKKTEK